MVNQSNFARVREAFAVNVTESLRRLSVEVKAGTPKGDWLQIACPLCPDKSGSASISVKSGYLRCHQCGGKADLFQWVGRHIGRDKPWDVCQELANTLSVEVEGPTKMKLYKRVPAITPDVVLDLKHRLFAAEDSEGARSFLASRKLWDPVLLEAMPIGALGECLVFFQHDNTGRLKDRAKVYNPRPPSGKSKWTYSDSKGASGRSVGFWPYLGAPEEGSMVLLCEGEWDVLSAIFRLNLMRKGMHVQCWTGGGGAPIPFDSVPEFFRNREVHIIYDNDVFQGVGDDLAPDMKKATEMRLRKKNLLDNVAEAFVANRCSVFLRKVTIDPLKQWGADLRDMIDSGLENFNEVPVFPLVDCRKAMVQAKKIEFSQVHQHVGQYVEFHCQVAAVNEDVILVPQRTHIVCAMGTKKACDICLVPVLAPNAVLEWAGKENQLASALTSTSPVRYIHENVLGKPSSCRPCDLQHLDTRPGARWTAMSREGDDEPGRGIEVISAGNPPLSGELKVRGWIYTAANSVTPILICDHLEAMDRVVIDIVPHKVDLFSQVPFDATSVEQIDDYLQRWHRDVSNNTTHIYGRFDMHMVIGLTMHSSLWLDVLGTKRRGWLDTCIIGATRTGKSAALRAYLQYIGLGQHHTPMGNFSRPGLTLGTVTINNQQKTRPGVFPRNHGKLVGLDEAHLMVQDNVSGGGLFPMLQGARDVGKVESAKVTGSQMLPAAVRLIAIANWIKGSKHSFGTPVEHLLALYGTPESLSRMDFAIPVHEITRGTGAESVPQFWTRDRQRVVAMRAWNLRPEDIDFDPEAIELARDYTESNWKDKYSEEVPLYTEKEKIFSLLRIGVSIANMTLAHRDNDVLRCYVRPVHIDWAAKWLEHTWKLLEYDSFSNIAMSRMGQLQVWKVEAQLTAGLYLADVVGVRYVLGRLFGILQREELRSVIGKNHSDFEAWTNSMIRLGALEIVRGQGPFSLGYRFTRSAIEIVQRLLMIADEFPETWASRYNVMFKLMAASGPAFKPPEDAVQIDAPIELLRHDLRRRCNFPQDNDAG